MHCMAVERLFVDTWAWLVLANDHDPAYARAIQRSVALAAPLS